jgi:hypothetical protein
MVALLLRMNRMPAQPAAVLFLTPTATACCSSGGSSSSSCGTRMVTEAAAAVACGASTDLMVGVVLRQHVRLHRPLLLLVLRTPNRWYKVLSTIPTIQRLPLALPTSCRHTHVLLLLLLFGAAAAADASSSTRSNHRTPTSTSRD